MARGSNIGTLLGYCGRQRRPIELELPKDLDVEISLGIIGLKERPSFHLSAVVMHWLARTGATLDVDIYDLSTE
jgi:hypothetical protein